MSKTKTDAVEAAVETTPKRSPARAVVAARIAARERAREVIEERQGAARRLVLIGEAAKALASQLAGAKAASAAALAEHALSGTGRVPALVEEGRADLVARLAEAEAQAEAAGPALVAVEGKITEAITAHHAASAAVAAVVRPVVEEEIAGLLSEVRGVMGRLHPMLERVAGARSWAYQNVHSGDQHDRDAWIRIGNSLDTAMRELRIDPQTPANGTDAAFAALAQRLTIDPDARAA